MYFRSSEAHLSKIPLFTANVSSTALAVAPYLCFRKMQEWCIRKTQTGMTYDKQRMSIKSWAVEDRPREKLLQRGRKELSDAELLAILIGSGNRRESAVDLCRRILHAMGNDLNRLGQISITELKKFSGIGEAKAVTIQAALELGHRRQSTDIHQRPQITCSRDAYEILQVNLVDLAHEEFWVLLLNRANRVIGRERISSGGVAGTVVDAKLVFSKALGQVACSVILAHNHPSGNLRPSQADLQLTTKLVKAGKNLDIAVLDHLIVTEAGYYSFADEGQL